LGLVILVKDKVYCCLKRKVSVFLHFLRFFKQLFHLRRDREIGFSENKKIEGQPQKGNREGCPYIIHGTILSIGATFTVALLNGCPS
jgi:hypothetical protein